MRISKLPLLLILGASFFFLAATLPPSLKSEPQNRDNYDWQQRHQQVIERHKTYKPAYVFIGDSITHWWGGEPVTKIKTIGNDSWNRIFANHKVSNLGFGFDYIDNAHYRVSHGEIDGISPRVVLINIGTNNIGHRGDNAETCATNMAELIKVIQTKLPQAKILLIGIYPRRELKFAATIKQTNLLYAKLADQKNIVFINPGEKLLSKDKQTADPRYMRDLVHLNPRGYAMIADSIIKTLKEMDSSY